MSFVGHPDGDNAADESGDEIDGAMPPKSFPIAVYRGSSLISRGSRRYMGLRLTSSNRGYPWLGNL
jgi:hypothetical protein